MQNGASHERRMTSVAWVIRCDAAHQKLLNFPLTMLPTVQLLGTAKVNLETKEVIFLSDKRFLLLAYLAFKSDWVSRDQLALLFFEDSDSVAARKNLRHLLSRVRALEFANLESSGEQVRWLVQSDVAQFQTLISSDCHLEALDLYHGQFLNGLHPDVPELSDWLEQEREALHNAFRDAALVAAKQLVLESNFEMTQKVCLRVLASDPLAEDVLQVLLSCAIQTGGRLEALRAFESFKTMLKQDLGLPPLETTLQLAAELSQKETKVVAPFEKSKLQNFPVQATSFVGRDVDLSEIASMFVQPQVRLLTLIGAGGMGKTRLAIQVALEQAPNFADGAVFVPLAGVDDLVAATIAALHLPAQSLEQQLVFLKNYLSQSQLLLVLDNMEHLLKQTTTILELLAAAPKLRILTTSRETLNVQAEYLVDVLGLDVPKADSEQIEIFDSVQLFLRNAKRVNPRFFLEPKDKPFITQICGLLQGSPLAIELASHWLRILKPEEVVQEIRLSLDFLSVNQPDVPLRHRSMRAVFNASWQLLNLEQQMVLATLSLLRGGFTLESLARVAKASASILFGLVSKSLIARNGNRFVIHEVIRQFAEQQLEPSQKEAALLELSLLSEDWAISVAIHDPERPIAEAIRNFDQEFENISLVLEWAVQNQPQVAARIVYSVIYFWIAGAKKQMGMYWLNRLLELPALQVRDSTRANLLYVRGVIGLRMVNSELRLADAELALEIALEIGDLSAEAKARHAIGEVRGDSGDYEIAISSIQKALELLQATPNINVETDCLNQLAFVYWLHGDIDLSSRAFKNLISKSLASNNKRSLANGYANYAYVYITQNNFEEAQKLLEQAIIIYREVRNLPNLCATLLTLGNVMFRRGHQLDLAKLLSEIGLLCPQVQDAACYTCFYSLSAAFMQQQQRHAKGLRLHAISKVWRSQPGLDFNLDELEPNQFIESQSAKFFSAKELQHFEAQAKSLSPKEAMQYALGTLEVFEDKQLSKLKV